MRPANVESSLASSTTTSAVTPRAVTWARSVVRTWRYQGPSTPLTART